MEAAMAEDGAPVETEQELRDLQLEGLRWTVGHANKGSAFYRGSFDRVGVTPDDIRTLEDLAVFPLPKPMICVRATLFPWSAFLPRISSVYTPHRGPRASVRYSPTLPKM